MRGNSDESFMTGLATAGNDNEIDLVGAAVARRGRTAWPPELASRSYFSRECR